MEKVPIRLQTSVSLVRLLEVALKEPIHQLMSVSPVHWLEVALKEPIPPKMQKWPANYIKLKKTQGDQDQEEEEKVVPKQLPKSLK